MSIKLKREMVEVYNRLKEGELNEDITKRIYEYCKKAHEYEDPELKELLRNIIRELGKVLDRRGKTRVIKIREGEVVKISDDLFVRCEGGRLCLYTIRRKSQKWIIL